MGKWAEKAYDDELLTKVKRLFESVKGKACGGLTEDGQEFTYEEFVETLDDNDKYIKKLFEHLVQEAANSQDRQRRRRLRTQGTPYSVTGSRNQNRHANISPYMETILARGFLDDTSATTQHSSLDSAGYGYLHNWFTPSGNVGESSSSSSSTAAAIEPSPMWSAYEEFDAERADLQPYPFTTAVSVAPALPPQPLSSALPRNPNEAPYSAPGPSALRRNRRLSLLSAIAATASDSSNGQGSSSSSSSSSSARTNRSTTAGATEQPQPSRWTRGYSMLRVPAGYPSAWPLATTLTPASTSTSTSTSASTVASTSASTSTTSAAAAAPSASAADHDDGSDYSWTPDEIIRLIQLTTRGAGSLR